METKKSNIESVRIAEVQRQSGMGHGPFIRSMNTVIPGERFSGIVVRNVKRRLHYKDKSGGGIVGSLPWNWPGGMLRNGEVVGYWQNGVVRSTE